MGTYNLPRNVKGEGRILYIFTTKSLIFSVIGGATGGILFYLIFAALGMQIAGLISVLIWAAIGYIIGSFKIPEGSSFAISKKVGGENIDDVIKRVILFKQSGRKIYMYEEEKTNDE